MHDARKKALELFAHMHEHTDLQQPCKSIQSIFTGHDKKFCHINNTGQECIQSHGFYVHLQHRPRQLGLLAVTYLPAPTSHAGTLPARYRAEIANNDAVSSPFVTSLRAARVKAQADGRTPVR